MSGLELAALGALGLGYLDGRLQFTKDLAVIKGGAGAGLYFGRAVLSKKLNRFYDFERTALANPDRPFVIYPEPVRGKKVKIINGVPEEPLDSLFNVKRYTYQQSYDKVLKYADVFYNHIGIRPGDVVAMDYVNKDEYIFVWFALWNLGAVPAFINYNLQTKALAHCVRAANSKFFVVDEEVRANGEAVADELKADGIPTFVVDDSFRAKVDAAPGFRLPDEQRPVPELRDPACYIFTSGTTGLPKAAIMSWKKAHGATLYSKVTRMKSSDVMYSAMPLYHSTAAVLGLLGTVSSGGTYAVGHRFSTTTFWTQVKLAEATLIQYVGETGRYLLAAPPSPDERNHKVRQAMGNGLRPDVWAKFKERFNIRIVDEFYGATESPIIITNHQVGSYGIGSCGSYGSLVTSVLQRFKFSVVAVDPDTQDLWRDPETGLGRRALPNEPGELVFKVQRDDIKADFQGYAGNEKATMEKIAYDLIAKGDAWARSGDLLRIDTDGNLYFVDRLGDTFRWKSENVSTNEVEEAITELPDINQAVVVGVAVPNHEGRAGFAVLQPKTPGGQPDMAALAKHLVERLPRYAVPIFVKVVESIETTGNNKVQKKQFRSQKIPDADSQIYWLVGDKYVLLTPESWRGVEAGQVKL